MHPEFQAQIDVALDGELAQAEGAALDAHLAGCATCRAFRDERLALREAIKGLAPQASDVLTRRVRSAVRAESGARRRFGVLPALAAAASLAVVAVSSWQLGARRAAATALADQVLASHIRGLMPGHLTDVTSTDQHTVKPWFNGKLDYSPPVSDFAGRGYPLVGGRLDYVGGQPVAALVYARRQHLITVYVWPEARGQASGIARDANGYHVRQWSSGGNVYWIASDLGAAELDEFAGLLRQGDSAAR
jgi:anti-sigma factor RsiW